MGGGRDGRSDFQEGVCASPAPHGSPRGHLPPASFTSIWSLSWRALAKGFPCAVLLVLPRAPRESVILPLWFSRDLGTRSSLGTGDAFPGWLGHLFLQSALTWNSPKPVHEIQNCEMESAASRGVKPLRHVGYSYFLLCIHQPVS